MPKRISHIPKTTYSQPGDAAWNTDRKTNDRKESFLPASLTNLLSFLLSVCVAAMLTGCFSAPVIEPNEIEAKYPASEYVAKNEKHVIDIYDPFERFNRGVYIFNSQFDKYLFLPVVNTYESLTPDFVEARVSNFFSNIGEINNLTNSLLQLKLKPFLKTGGRIVINSTIGMLGLFDPATTLKIYRQDEDFGQTLGFYGLSGGPYLVLPLLGPSTLRDTAGYAVDFAVSGKITDEIIAEFDMDNSDEDIFRKGKTILNTIDTRRKQGFRYYQTGSPFEYDQIRLLYSRKRQLQINK